MATAQPHPSSRRSRDPPRDDVTVGNFRRLEEIGKGSFATVYKAVHVQKGAFVAIKSVQLQKLNKKLKENLYSEIHILKGLHHPHIVALIDCQESVHHIHLVMEFCQLGDLSYFIKKREKLAGHAATAEMVRKYPNPPGGGLNEVVVRHFLKQLASALEFLRAKNFIHRDVKPQNLLLNPSPLFFAKAQPEMMPLAASENSLVPVVGVESLPMLKIADFGFARSLPSTSLAETLCGSPLYMAPEILRYEKYDAKADLWSVGTVLYEMVVGKPPFRASNHVELLRKIERGEDRIKFPEEVILSDNMKKLIRGLLKRSPVERMGFTEFFDDTVVKDEIPGLVGDDVKPSETPRPESKKPQVLQDEKVTGLRQQSTPTSHTRQPQNEGSRQSESPPERFYTAPQTRAESSPMVRQRSDATGRLSSEARRYSGQALRPPSSGQRNSPDPSRRPGMISHATAPARQEQSERPPVAAAVAMERQTSGTSASPGSSFLKEQGRTREQQPIRRDNYTTREAREKADQEVAFERDYVVVEKRAVEVNAFADELAASPRLHGAYHDQGSQQQGAMIRRATVSGGGNGPAGIQASPSRAMQIATGRHRSDNMGHQPKSSYERRYGASPTSATSAISKALNMANFRLFGMGFSPPLGGKSQSPPQLYGYPAYPTPQGHLITTDGKTTIPLGEDSKAIHVIEELATRSDVVYGFAEVKYKQLIPLAPSAEHGLGLHQAGVEGGEAVDDDEGLTIDATVTLSEEALVLYVKALSLLAKSMDTAGAWWARKNRGEVVDHSTPRTDSNTPTGVAVGARINNVVQWVRTRFNEVLEKAEFVRRKLIESQNRLPLDHPSHPRNRSAASTSTMEMGTSTEGVFVSPGVTAERLMYDRAVEMSRAAAVNELVGEDLAGCEIAYITAQRMLEAVLENDEELNPSRKGSLTGKEGVKADKEPINGLEAEDREVVEKMVVGIRGRLAALRKKIAMLKRSSLQQPPAPVRTPSTTATTGTPAVATTPPQ